MNNKNNDCLEAILSNDYIDIIVPYSISPEEIAKEYNATCYQILNENYMVLHIKVDVSEICYIEAGGHNLTFLNDVAILGSSIKKNIDSNRISYVPDYSKLNLSGKDVIIGIINSGIDYTLPIFINENGESKILNIWDQTIQGNPPENFLYGTEYTREQINEAIRSDQPYNIVPHIDEIGYGTYLAGISAGGEDKEKQFVGVAKDAELIIVKLKPAKEIIKKWILCFDPSIPTYQDTDIMIGANYLIEKARLYNKPLVILIALSTTDGTHSGTALSELFFSNIADRTGIVIVVSAGNEANKPHHYQNILKNTDAYQDVEINVAEGEKGILCSLITTTPDMLSISFISPTGNSISRVSPRYFYEDIINLYLENTKICISHYLIPGRLFSQVYLIRLYEPTNGVWTFRVFGDVVVSGKYYMWMPIAGFIKPNTGFNNSVSQITITIPSTAPKVITVGAYNDITNSIYVASGRGYTVDNFVKPNIVAPGVSIYGPFPDNEYVTMTGTEVSAGIVAGISALLLEWGIVKGNDKQINTAIVNNYLIKGARRRAVFKYPNNTWGYGEVDLYNTFEILKYL